MQYLEVAAPPVIPEVPNTVSKCSRNSVCGLTSCDPPQGDRCWAILSRCVKSLGRKEGQEPAGGTGGTEVEVTTDQNIPAATVELELCPTRKFAHVVALDLRTSCQPHITIGRTTFAHNSNATAQLIHPPSSWQSPNP